MPRLVVAHFRWFTLAWWDLNSTARFERPVSLVWANRINRTIWTNHSASALRLSLLSLLSLLYLKQKLTVTPRWRSGSAISLSKSSSWHWLCCMHSWWDAQIRSREGLVGHSDSCGDTARQFGWDGSAIPGMTSRVSSPVSVLICVDLVLFVVWPSLSVLYRAFVLFEA